MQSHGIGRREFLKGGTSGLAAVATAAPQRAEAKTVGVQVGAVSFVDEGVEQVLDIFQERGRVNTLFLAVFTYGRGIAGRQIPGQPFPDHGRQEYDLDFRGGNFAAVHPEFYKDTVLKDTRALDYGDLDVLATVLPAARKRGLRTFCWLEDVFRDDIPNIRQLQEVDLYGRNRATLCFNNADYRGFLLGLVQDYVRSYDIDGIMWGSERQGALGNALGASHGGARSDPGRAGCFCGFCERKAKERGIDFSRAKEGFRTLETFVNNSRSGRRPADGHFVTFWRILLRYPEILAWEMFWTDSLRETYAAIYGKVKSVKPQIPVGWHIWHNNSFSPFYRAEQDIRELSRYSDFLKIVMYHNCAGERIASYIDSVGASVFADIPKQELLDLHYRVMNFSERGYGQVPFTGFSADYVARETRRALEGAAGTKTRIWPGIDIDIPTGADHSKSTPQGTKAAVLAAFRAGADGVILSRKYSEMRLANLAAAGEAIRELGVA